MDILSKRGDWIDCKEWDGDGYWRLNDLAELIDKLRKKYGSNAVIHFDAGANNVSIKLVPTRKLHS